MFNENITFLEKISYKGTKEQREKVYQMIRKSGCRITVNQGIWIYCLKKPQEHKGTREQRILLTNKSAQNVILWSKITYYSIFTLKNSLHAQ
jgi:hypothetical protein